jgi:TonB family protein
LWNLSCILLSDGEAAFKRRLLVLAACVTAGLFAAGAVFGVVTGGRTRASRAQQEKSAASIVRGIGSRVLIGQVQAEVAADQLGVMRVQQKLEEDADAYRACYAAGLRSHPTAAGYFLVSLTVEADGRVRTASVLRSSGATSIEHCIAERMRRVEFVPASNANAVSISVPLRLDPDAMPPPVDGSRREQVEP